MKSRLLEKKDIVKYISLEIDKNKSYYEMEEAKFLLEPLGVYPAIEFKNSDDVYTLVYELEAIDGKVYNRLCEWLCWVYRGNNEGITIYPMITTRKAVGEIKMNANKKPIGFREMVMLDQTAKAYNKVMEAKERSRKNRLKVVR